MGRTLLLFVLIFSTLASEAQLYPSDCIAPDSIKALYKTDAQRLALRRVYKFHLPGMNADTIPALQTDTALQALVTLYNAATMPARDTVINKFNIHSFAQGGLDSPYKFSMNRLQIWADETEQWMQDFKNGIIPTSDTLINQLLLDYHLTLDTYVDLTSGIDGLYFTSDSNYNMDAVAVLWGQAYFAVGGDMGAVGDASDILLDTVTSTYTQLTFKYGWGDCPSGCVYNRYWTFQVNFDCTVTYVGSYGDTIPALSVTGITKNDVAVYPNPFNRDLYVDNVKANTAYHLYNSTGVLVMNGIVSAKQPIITDLPQGVYFLKLSADDGVKVMKLVRE